jgi:dipeptide/tripeptide permease
MKRYRLSNLPLYPPSAWLILLTALIFSMGYLVTFKLQYIALPANHLDLGSIDSILSTFIALTLMFGIFGGIAGYYLGPKTAFLVGGIICVIGMLLLSQNNIVYSGIACFLVGSGLLKPNIFNCLSLLVPRHSQLRYRAFCLIFFADNMGMVLGGVIATHFTSLTNISNAFLMIGFITIGALFIFIFMSFVVFANNRLDRSNTANLNLLVIGLVYLMTVALIILADFLLQQKQELLIIITALICVLLALIIMLHQYRRLAMPLLRHGYRLQASCQLLCMLYWALFSINIVNVYLLFPWEPNVSPGELHQKLLPHLSFHAIAVSVIGIIWLVKYSLSHATLTRDPAQRICYGLIVMAVASLLTWHVFSPLTQHTPIPNWLGLLISQLCVAYASYCIVPTQLAMIAHWLSRHYEPLMMGISQLVIGITWVIIKITMYHMTLNTATSSLYVLTSLLNIVAATTLIIAFICWYIFRYAIPNTTVPS